MNYRKYNQVVMIWNTVTPMWRHCKLRREEKYTQGRSVIYWIWKYKTETRSNYSQLSAITIIYTNFDSCSIETNCDEIWIKVPWYFIREYTFEYVVCKTVARFSRSQCSIVHYPGAIITHADWPTSSCWPYRRHAISNNHVYLTVTSM